MVHRLGIDRLFLSVKPDEVRSILVRLADDLDTDLTRKRIEAFCAELPDEGSEDDPLLEAEVIHEGRPVPLVFEYVRDSESGDELMILGPPPVVEQIQQRVSSLHGEGSLRLIPAERE